MGARSSMGRVWCHVYGNSHEHSLETSVTTVCAIGNSNLANVERNRFGPPGASVSWLVFFSHMIKNILAWAEGILSVSWIRYWERERERAQEMTHDLPNCHFVCDANDAYCSREHLWYIYTYLYICRGTIRGVFEVVATWQVQTKHFFTSVDTIYLHTKRNLAIYTSPPVNIYICIYIADYIQMHVQTNVENIM